MQISQSVSEEKVFLPLKISLTEIASKGKLTQQNGCIITISSGVHISLVPNKK